MHLFAIAFLTLFTPRASFAAKRGNIKFEDEVTKVADIEVKMLTIGNDVLSMFRGLFPYRTIFNAETGKFEIIVEYIAKSAGESAKQIERLAKLPQNLSDMEFLNSHAVRATGRTEMTGYIEDLESLNDLFFEGSRVICVLTKMPEEDAIPVVKSFYLDALRRLRTRLNTLIKAYPAANVAREMPLPDPEQFDFVPKDLAGFDESPSACEPTDGPLTTSNYEEKLIEFLHNIYQASFGIHGIDSLDYKTWLLAYPDLDHYIEEVTNEDTRKKGACLFAFETSDFNELRELCRKVYIANFGLKALLNNENGKIREAHLINVIAEYIVFLKYCLGEYAEDHDLKAILVEVVFDFNELAEPEMERSEALVDSADDEDEDENQHLVEGSLVIREKHISVEESETMSDGEPEPQD